MSMSTAFKPGDLVRLKSGGPKMTVSHRTGENELCCIWFASEGKKQNDVFKGETLKLVEDDA